MGDVVAAVLGMTGGVVVGMWAALWVSRPTLIKMGFGAGYLIGLGVGWFKGLRMGKGGWHGKG